MFTWTETEADGLPTVTSVEAVWNSDFNRYDLVINGNFAGIDKTGAIIILDDKEFDVSGQITDA